MWQFVFIVGAVVFRLATLAVSQRNERRLKARGAVEVGKTASSALALAHTAFYLSAVAESLLAARQPLDPTALAGIVLYLFGAIMLLVVISSLGRLWTVKLLIAPDHVLHVSPLFRWFRHPNYYLGILPELVGLALALHAFATLLIGLPLYLVLLSVRIRQENAAMRAKFAEY